LLLQPSASGGAQLASKSAVFLAFFTAQEKPTADFHNAISKIKKK